MVLGIQIIVTPRTAAVRRIPVVPLATQGQETTAGFQGLAGSNDYISTL